MKLVITSRYVILKHALYYVNRSLNFSVLTQLDMLSIIDFDFGCVKSTSTHTSHTSNSRQASISLCNASDLSTLLYITLSLSNSVKPFY